MSASSLAVEMLGIHKEFAGVEVLHNVNLNVRKGEIHALVGENGAGKSTLIKILGGYHPRNSFQGEIRVFGETANFNSIHEAESMGIATVHQELCLVPELSVAENIFLRHLANQYGVVNWHKVNAEAAKLLDSFGIDLDPTIPVRALSVGLQQMVAIARALARNAKILILDEPTAALPEAEVQTLFRIIRDLAQRGVTCIYISHRLQEVLELSDRITVLRDGCVIGTHDTKDLNHELVVAKMVGRSLTEVFPTKSAPSPEVIMEVKNLSVPHPILPRRRLLDNISFSVKRGEILGIAGLMGSGRSELLNAIFGSLQAPMEGTIVLENVCISNHNPRTAIRAGIVLVTEERKKDGLVLGMGLRENVTLANLDSVSHGNILDFAKEREVAEEFAKSFRINCRSIEQVVMTLSGGNQQKVVLAKWLSTDPKVLLLDEPTRGIDVGAKAEIYRWVTELAKEGVAVLMASSELPEVLGLSHRIMVLHEGKVSGIIQNTPTTSEEEIMMLATGGKTLFEEAPLLQRM